MSRWACWLLGLLVGCGGSSTPTAVVPLGPEEAEPADDRFPSRAELETLAQRRGDASLGAPEAPVERWDLVGPFPDAIGATPVVDADAWEERLQAQGAVVSMQMRCAARELGRFYVANERSASPALERFILSRCGVAAAHVSRAVLAGEQDPAGDEGLDAALQAQIHGLLDDTPAGVEAGVWVGREGDFGAALRLTARAEVRVGQAARTPDEHGWLRLEGELLVPAERIEVLVNQGEWGVQPCVLDPFIALPRFVALCAPQADDDSAWIEVAAFPPGRDLGRGVLQHLTWPAGAAPSGYARATSTAAQIEDDLEATLARLVSDARRAAGLPALAVSREQSEIARKLAPHYFAAEVGRDGGTSDMVALGLMAGWEVDARVERGWFQSRLVGEAELGRLIGDMVERPFGRRVLLNPHARVLALGSVRDSSTGAAGVLFATYATVEAFDAAAARAAAWAALDAQRKLAQLAPSVPLPQAQEAVDRACDRVSRGEVGARAGLDEALSDAVDAIGTSARGSLSTAAVLEEAQFTAELVSSPHPVALCVALHRRAGSPWWTYSVLAVTGEPTERYDQLKLPGET